jgi:Inositol phospholipid synthesis and fat-storage-inducing TM
LVSPTALSSTSSGPLTPGVASHINTPTTPQALSYFAGKQNILNLYFVKIGWFWTTLAFILLQLTTAATKAKPTHQQHCSSTTTTSNRSKLQPLLRYILITLSWIMTTQWFFGPALIDRSFTSTGGRCVPHPASSSGGPASDDADLSAIATSLSCKLHGGKWHGGHDISGHSFMLVLSSAFLFLEFLISESRAHAAHPHISASAAAQIARDTTEEEKRAVGGWESEGAARARLWASYLVWAVIALDVWMLLMTAVWFHTLFEKVSGLALAALTVWAVYFLPRFLPRWRTLVGGV